MREKYLTCGLNYDLIIDQYPDLNEYEKILHIYLDDEFFSGLKTYLENEDYALAKDATKGLYILAADLKIFPLYERLLDIYEDIEDENYKALNDDYDRMIAVHHQIKNGFSC